MMRVNAARYDERKLTIFTTNYGDARGQPAKETPQGRGGARFGGLLQEVRGTVAVEGEDRRRRLAAQR